MKRKWWIVGVLAALELAVCTGIVVLLWSGRSRLDRVRFFYVSDTYVEDAIEKTFSVDGPAILDVDVAADDVTVTGRTEGEIRVVAWLHLWGEDEQDAREQMEVKMTQEGNRVIIRVEYVPQISVFTINRGSYVDLEIQVPDETELLVAASSGDVAVSDVVGSADLGTTSGSLTVERFDGAIKVGASSGDVSLRSVTNAGDMAVEATAGRITFNDIDAETATINGSSGDVTLTNLEAAGDVSIGTTSGHVRLQELEAANLVIDVSSGGANLDELSIGGDVDIETSSGNVVLDGFAAASLKVRGSSSRIQISDGAIDGMLDLENTSSRISAVSVEAVSYRLVSSSGDVFLDGCSGLLSLRTTAGTIKVENATAAHLEIETSSGGVTFAGSLATEGASSVKSTAGNVRLTLPSDLAFDVDIATTSGNIRTDFVVGMTTIDEDRVVGSVNDGGPLLEIKTSSGDVTLTSVD